MSQSTRLLFGGSTYLCQPGETVLDALLRQGASIPHDCRKQTCLTCLMRALDAPPPPEAQINLKATLTVQNYFLACACRPVRDMEIVQQGAALSQELTARVAGLERLNARVLEITLQCAHPLDYRGGQTLILLNRDGIGKPFAIASPSSQRLDGQVVIQVERIPGCCFCGWLHDHLRVGDTLRVFGPTGYMFFVPGNPRQPLLLAAWQGGLGGVIGILQDVFEHGHGGPVYLFHGASHRSELYLGDDLREIEAYYPNFRYVPCVAEGPVPEGGFTGAVPDSIKRLLPDLGGWRLFLAGHRDFVDRLRRNAYLDGASIKDILFEITAA